MAQCGIKEYDKLPARVGFIDVDYLRYRLVAIARWRDEVIKELEKARQKVEGK